MFQPLYIAATGLSALEDQIMDITNNMTNASTVAFKKSRSETESLFYIDKSFKDILYEEMSGTQVPPVNVEYGTGVRVAATSLDNSQGAISVTNKPLDLAIQGEGYFQVKMPDGSTAYSRAGNFRLDDQGNIVAPNGRILEPGIVLPQGTTSISIRQDGVVFAQINNGSDFSEIGQITLARFTNPAGLKTLGQNLYAATESAGEPVVGAANQDGYGSINQYSLEQSNVDVISEMMRMVMVQRVFDTVTKAVATYENMLTATERMKA